VPEIVDALSMWTAKKICCSKDSTFALMESGELLVWGSSKYGVLGLGDISEDQFFPIKVIVDYQCDDSIEIIDISAGKNHVGIICRKINLD
jgi:alpha-tubulin suppressor-like RCC1 family protein